MPPVAQGHKATSHLGLACITARKAECVCVCACVSPVGSGLKPYLLQCEHVCLSTVPLPLEQNLHFAVLPISHIAPHLSSATTVGHFGGWLGGGCITKTSNQQAETQPIDQ